MKRGIGVGIVVALLLSLGLFGSASAHAKLFSSAPAAAAASAPTAAAKPTTAPAAAANPQNLPKTGAGGSDVRIYILIAAAILLIGGLALRRTRRSTR